MATLGQHEPADDADDREFIGYADGDVPLTSRLRTHAAVTTALAEYSDRALLELVDGAAPLGAGIGGTSVLVEVAGQPVFVKRVALSDLERQHGNVRSTANMFGLPQFYHYGVGLVGGAGFGAWRELAVHRLTTDWVIAGEYQGFPLMYHWRVLPAEGALPDELADIDRVVGYWGGTQEIRRRIEAVRDSSASIALFLEYIPQTLHRWLNDRFAAGAQAADQACAMVERELAGGVAFMNSCGMLHLDAHFHNILTDGHRLYFGDYGLALSSRFDLAPEESAFFDRNQSYDRAFSVTYLVNWLLTTLYGLEPGDREARATMVRAIAAGTPPRNVTAQAAALLTRHAPVAAAMSEFMLAFQRESRTVPYPDELIRRLLDHGTS
ncbi:protein kinase family protein [Nocardia sp. NPDC005978]|uniref:protein kinase family protein n=1 Tax=Nocardia sp. NPDC005978 TaxID=3156725 RepID=UPI0033A509C8